MFLSKFHFRVIAGLTFLHFAVGIQLSDRAVRAAEPKQGRPEIRMEVSAPEYRKPDPMLLPDFGYWEIKVKYKNESKQEVVLSPFVTLKVYDSAGKPVENDAFIGAGFISEEWMSMMEKKFLVIPAGKTGEVVVNLADNRSPGNTIGWDFKKAGTYKIVVTHQHSRQAFAKQYISRSFFLSNDALEKAKLAQRMWNRAIEMERSVETKLVVK